MKLAADANVLLSAVIGGRAQLVFSHPKVHEIITTEHTFAEMEEYVPTLASRRGLPADVLTLAVAALPVTIVKRSAYDELLALALHFRIPIWSNDKDFTSARVELFTTEDLLRHLRIIE